MKKDISVIVPCFNVEKYIDSLLCSLVCQTIGMERLELIFIDDASEDGTVQKLEEWERRYEDTILVIRCGTNGCQGTARNIGLSYATGDFVCFVDADDYIAINALEILYQLITQTECDIVQFRYCSQKERLEHICFEQVRYQVYDFSESECRRNYCINSSVLNESCTTKFYRRELLVRAGVRYAENVAYEEPLFTYPLNFFVNKVCVTETAFYFYRYNEFGTTAKHMAKLETIMEHLQVQVELLQFLRMQPFFVEYQKEIELHFVHSYYISVFYFLKYRGMPMPISLFRFLCDTVRHIIPDYKSNPYWQDISLVEERKLVSLIDLEISKEVDEAEIGQRLYEIMQTI